MVLLGRRWLIYTIDTYTARPAAVQAQRLPIRAPGRQLGTRVDESPLGPEEVTARPRPACAEGGGRKSTSSPLQPQSDNFPLLACFSEMKPHDICPDMTTEREREGPRRGRNSWDVARVEGLHGPGVMPSR